MYFLSKDDWEAAREGGSGALTQYILKNSLIAFIPWLGVIYEYGFTPQYFVSWDDNQINWQLPGMKSITTLDRSTVSDIQYKPFVLKVTTTTRQHEIDLSPFKDKAAEQIKTGLKGL
jgi:hypothetical protein